MCVTAIGLPPSGSSTVHIYTQTIYRTTQQQLWLEGFLGFELRVVKLRLTMNLLLKNYCLMGRVRAMPRLCEENPGICPTTEEKARKNLSV